MQSVGCFLGSTAAISKFAFKRTTPFSNTLLKYNTIANITSSVASPIMVEMRMKNKMEIEWQDRSWRLLQNEKQLVIDKYVASGIGFGVIVGSVLPFGGLASRVIGGAGMGSASGFVAAQAKLQLNKRA